MNTDNDWPNEITDFTKPGVKDLPEYYEVNAWWRCSCFATKEEADKLSAQWSLEPQHPSQHPLRAPVGVTWVRNGVYVCTWYWGSGKCLEFLGWGPSSGTRQ